jgi:TPP-dependent indolepyruvate ferredoxin oxidoreductase alpha subunit
MDMTSFNEWADGLDLIVVVEEKRKLIEVQIKEAIFDSPPRPPRLRLVQGRRGRACTRRNCSRRAWRSTR